MATYRRQSTNTVSPYTSPFWTRSTRTLERTNAMRPRHYRMDGSPYPEGDVGLLEWAMDLEKPRHVAQDLLWNGILVSTVWLGLDHNYSEWGPPLIFETMTFDHLRQYSTYREEQERYSTYEDAEEGHRRMVDKVSAPYYTLRLWLMEIFEY